MSMRQFNTVMTIEPCEVLEVYPDKMMAKVRGKRNIGPEVLVAWTDYSHPGSFGSEDASSAGRLPEKGALAMVTAEWTDDQYRQLLKAYITGYIPRPSVDFAKEGYAPFLSKQFEPLLPGEQRTSTGSRSYTSMSPTGAIHTEVSPNNYTRRVPEENSTHDVCDNSHRQVGNCIESVTYDKKKPDGTHYFHGTWAHPPATEYSPASTDNSEALGDTGSKNNYDSNTVIYEERGAGIKEDATSFTGANAIGLPASFTTIAYKFVIAQNGKPVYTKLIDIKGNVYEIAKGNFTRVVVDDAGGVIYSESIDPNGTVVEQAKTSFLRRLLGSTENFMQWTWDGVTGLIRHIWQIDLYQ